MLIILSPAKNLDFSPANINLQTSTIPFPDKVRKLVDILKRYSANELSDIMKMSVKLGELNYKRYQQWEIEKARNAAIVTYSGEVFNGLQARSLNASQLNFANDHVRILSGLYGVLRPFDAIQPYRLDMEHKLPIDNFKNLYDYWGDLICDHLNNTLNNTSSKVLINLASNEYSKAARLNKVNGKVITPVFKQLKGEQYKIVAIYAKKARGLMTRFIIENEITDPEHVKLFDEDGYFYNEPLSTDREWVFTR